MLVQKVRVYHQWPAKYLLCAENIIFQESKKLVQLCIYSTQIIENDNAPWRQKNELEQWIFPNACAFERQIQQARKSHFHNFFT